MLPDASAAHSQCHSNTGNELSVNHKKAILEDSIIRECIEREIAGVKADVQNLFDGEAFEFHSSNAQSVPNGDTENWQKAIGRHCIWSKGLVKINEEDCKLDINFTTFVKDCYNFNPGQKDIGLGLPDDDNCLFSILGCANGFHSRGDISHSTSVDLECCEDTKCDSGEVAGIMSECCPVQELASSVDK